jgi:hypothetical protein
MAQEEESKLLSQFARKDLREAGQLISKAAAPVEVDVPSVAREAPVADVGDLPVGRRFDFDNEIHATAISRVHLTPAEDHLTTLPNTTDLPWGESEWDQDRIEDLRNQVRTTMPRRLET